MGFMKGGRCIVVLLIQIQSALLYNRRLPSWILPAMVKCGTDLQGGGWKRDCRCVPALIDGLQQARGRVGRDSSLTSPYLHTIPAS